MIYLYVEPVARRSWCAKTGIEFLLPPQQNVHQSEAQHSSLAGGQHQHIESRGGLTGSSLPPPSYEEAYNIQKNERLIF